MEFKNFRLRDSAGKWAMKDLPEQNRKRAKDVEFVVIRADSAFFDNLVRGNDDEVLVVPPRRK